MLELFVVVFGETWEKVSKRNRCGNRNNYKKEEPLN